MQAPPNTTIQTQGPLPGGAVAAFAPPPQQPRAAMTGDGPQPLTMLTPASQSPFLIPPRSRRCRKIGYGNAKLKQVFTAELGTV